MAEADDDAFYVLTAVLLTPGQFPAVLADDYPAACAVLGLDPRPDGYGLVLGQDSEGARWTVAVTDTALVACAVAAWDCGMEYDLSPSERTIATVLPGWPLALAVSAPDLPPPHDPDPAECDVPALTPPDSTAWNAARRRLGADEIALQWAQYRARVDDDVTFVAPGEKPNGAVARVLGEAGAYVHDPPPPGRVRSSYAGDGARTLRVDGPGWSLVARTDDIAFVLLDDAPGEVVPVGRGPELPGLLTSLDRLVRGRVTAPGPGE